MKVLAVNSVCGIRSTGRICTDLADVLSSAGHECRIVYGRECVPKQYQKIAVRIGSEMNVRWHGLMSRLFGKCGFYSKGATKKLIKEIERYQPDIIHLHNLHGYYLHIGMLFQFLQKSEIPVVWTLHDCWPFTGHCAHFVEANCEQWKTKCVQCTMTKTYPACWFWDNVEKNYERKRSVITQVNNMVVITPSHWLSEVVNQSFLQKYPVEVIHNGIDLSAFYPQKGNFRSIYHLENKHIVLGVASAWSRSKGLYDFIELASQLPEDYQVVLVGLTAKQISKVPRTILCIERTDSIQELAEIYSTADVFVNPTWADTFPTVNLEALACGTPIVTYRTGGSTEIVKKSCGSVVAVGDLQSLSHEVQRIVQTKPYSKEECIQEAAQYEKTLQFQKYIKLYESICSSKLGNR